MLASLSPFDLFASPGLLLYGKMVIDFSASWCGPCRFVKPAFRAMAAQYTDAVFLKIDVDELREVSRQWKVQAMPTFVLLVKGGQEVARVVGAMKDELERRIQEQLASGGGG
ncbi:hypothetical protein B296_00032061 [Ensete ventricosum]|uniref:Thioredoxin domain-containing protein n=1 Tax=Ensete ventricosum TaxID=4639 RepID=A0A426XAX4_ENSVE|nr:hypothetical protein B296_00032061 [Ensete ventricosum]